MRMTLLNIQIQEHSFFFFLREKTIALEYSRSKTMVYKHNTCQMEYGLWQTNFNAQNNKLNVKSP